MDDKETEREALGKTDLVRDFFSKRPARVFSPAEVSATVKIGSQVAIAILARLVDEGYLRKVGRGQFIRDPTVTPDDFRNAHLAIAKVVDSLIGRDVASSMIGDGAFKFDESRGAESVTELIIGIQKVFGKEYADRLVQHAFSSEFGSRSKAVLDHVLGPAGVNA